MSTWSPTSWQKYRYEQSVTYDDNTELNNVVNKLSSLPPLVTVDEIKKLKLEIARAGAGDTFILQGGDCAESFKDCNANTITNKLKILLQMSLIMVHGIHKPIVLMGRIAGQFTKPRSESMETIKGVKLPCYRGDLINSQEFDKKSRTPDPQRLIQGYNFASATLNYIRGLLQGGFANLNDLKRWDLDDVEHLIQTQEYHEIVKSIINSLEIFKSIGAVKSNHHNEVDFYTSHEALHLHYEQALTRNDTKWYNLSTHFPWVGIRTSMLDSAHIEYLRGIANPIGIKIGPDAHDAWLKDILTALNPEHEAGRIVLISRFGNKNVQKYLPPLIKVVKETNIPVTWICDPMHGNTEITKDGIKTRHFDNITGEIHQSLLIHRELDSHLGGIHLELTGENVTECIGGARGLAACDLKKAYHSLIDPRLNYEQSLEVALQLSSQFASL